MRLHFKKITFSSCIHFFLVKLSMFVVLHKFASVVLGENRNNPSVFLAAESTFCFLTTYLEIIDKNSQKPHIKSHHSPQKSRGLINLHRLPHLPKTQVTHDSKGFSMLAIIISWDIFWCDFLKDDLLGTLF